MKRKEDDLNQTSRELCSSFHLHWPRLMMRRRSRKPCEASWTKNGGSFGRISGGFPWNCGIFCWFHIRLSLVVGFVNVDVLLYVYVYIPWMVWGNSRAFQNSMSNVSVKFSSKKKAAELWRSGVNPGIHELKLELEWNPKSSGIGMFHPKTVKTRVESFTLPNFNISLPENRPSRTKKTSLPVPPFFRDYVKLWGGITFVNSGMPP